VCLGVGTLRLCDIRPVPDGISRLTLTTRGKDVVEGSYNEQIKVCFSSGRVLGGAFIGAIAAPTASAYPGDYGYSSNEVGFCNDVSYIGINSDAGPRGIVQVGWGICRDLALGYARESVAKDLFYNTAVGQGVGGITLAQARARYRSQ
jgi:hypothetical protein